MQFVEPLGVTDSSVEVAWEYGAESHAIPPSADSDWNGLLRQLAR
jgi:hypothetical protein